MTFAETVFSWIENTPLSEWMRGESLLAFPLILVLHTIGMGFFVGASAAIDFRLLGAAKYVPLKAMARFIPVAWFGFAMNAISGIFLLIGYPYKAFTNGVFYVKMALLLFALVVFLDVKDRVFAAPNPAEAAQTPRTKVLSILSLFLLVGAITAGRLLAYTYTWLTVGVPAGF